MTLMANMIVSNTGPMISLEKLSDGFEFIRRLHDKIILPEAVLGELAGHNFEIPSDYVKSYHIENLIEIRPVFKISAIQEIERLDEGEQHAITLALQPGLPLLIEETLGRQIALSAGIKISGIAGQIMKAFKEGLIGSEEAAKKLLEMFSTGRINRKIYNSLAASLK